MLIFQGTCNNTIVILILENHVGGLLKKKYGIFMFFNLKLWEKSSYFFKNLSQYQDQNFLFHTSI